MSGVPSPMEDVDIPGLDPGIAIAVGILRRNGIPTYESCQGGSGHCSIEPFVKFGGSVAEAMHAMAVVLFDPSHGLQPYELRQVWTLHDGWPNGPKWELVFRPPYGWPDDHGVNVSGGTP